MRIVQVVTTDQFAGTERYAVEVARGLGARGHQVAVVGGDPARMRPLLAGAAVWLPGGTPRAAISSIRRLGRADVVHSHITRSDFVAAVTKPLSRAALVTTRHITAPRGHSSVARALAPLVRRAFSSEVTVSSWMATQLRPPPDYVLLNGVPAAEAVEPWRNRTVLVLQRLAAEKDTRTALHAWAASGLGSAGWRLRVAGDGPERPALEREAHALGIGSSVDFLGWVADVERLWGEAAILLAPPASEPFGLSIVEAMAHGVPVVAAGSAGHLETVGAAGGDLFPPGDAGRAAELVQRLADDPGRRRDYGTSLRAYQRQHLGLDDHVARLEGLYRGLRGRR